MGTDGTAEARILEQRFRPEIGKRPVERFVHRLFTLNGGRLRSRAWERVREAPSEGDVAAQAQGFRPGPAEQQSEQIAARTLDGRLRVRSLVDRSRLDRPASDLHPIGGPVRGREQPGPLQIRIENTVVGTPRVEPVEASGQRDPYEELGPVAEPEEEITAVDLELGESEQRQPGEVDRPEVGVVVWFDDGRTPSLGGEAAPQTLKLVVALPQRADDVDGALAIPRLERARALSSAALGVEGRRTTLRGRRLSSGRALLRRIGGGRRWSAGSSPGARRAMRATRRRASRARRGRRWRAVHRPRPGVGAPGR